MADAPANVKDVTRFVTLDSLNESELGLTVFCNAGPITVLAGDPVAPQTYTFAADPFFRRNNNYVAVGAVGYALPPNPPAPAAPKLAVFLVTFTNHYGPAEQPVSPFAPRYRIQLTSLRRASPKLLVDLEGDLPNGETRNFQILVTRGS